MRSKKLWSAGSEKRRHSSQKVSVTMKISGYMFAVALIPPNQGEPDIESDFLPVGYRSRGAV